MQRKNLSRAAMLTITIVGCACFLLTLPLSSGLEAQAASERPLPGATFLRVPQEDVGLPVRLRIPSIKVDAAIESVGLTAKKAMDTPDDPNNAGWYNLGPSPGEKGSAVIAGHLDWYHGKTGVFQHLNRLKKGDILSVETDKGKFHLFVVREIRTYRPYEYAPDVFRGSDDGKHLNLVTCGGVWDTVRKIYSKRLVIFTDAVEE